MDPVFLLEIMFIVILALIVLFICNFLKIPSIIGYILSGILAGPFVLSLVGSRDIIELFAEIGIIFLLFTIGIQFSLKTFFESKKLVVIGGALQLVLTTGIVTAATLFAGAPLPQALFLGFLVSLSSTAIVMKILQERGELESIQGKTALSILIFQDLMLIPLMFITPILAGTGSFSPASIALLVVTGIVILVIVLITSRYVIPRLLYYSAKVRSQELFLLSVIAICFSVAWIISQTGVSLALGAFIAGLILSESEFSVAALSHIMPFRDLFAGFFFISIGMLLDVGVFFSMPVLIIALAIGVIALKFCTGAMATLFLGLPARTGILTGFALCQIGEFSFILASTGEGLGLISGTVYQVIIDITLITMVATPFFIAGSHRIAARISGGMEQLVGPSCEFDLTRAPAMTGHLIIVGYGFNGMNVARAAKYAGIPYRIIELNPDTVREYCEAGEPIFYGDATQQAVLELAGIRDARHLVVVIADRIATEQIVQGARALSARVHILVRTRFMNEVPVLQNLGADEVIPEEFETSIEIFTRVLRNFNIPAPEVNHLVGEVRTENYEMLRQPLPSPVPPLPKQLPELEVGSFRVGPEDSFTGKNLAEISWRKEKGISVIAIQRGGQALLNPGPDTSLERDDLVYFIGSTDNVRKFLLARE
ncbi:CPA2 family monovalent cation:H+ antiporter-2 [Methanolinea mesophila]|uniref:cation:proton antiporter domain-containing protein n=1 Tax=Methanolinea mesophila TaxID=547055 RepID=UPI001AE4E3DE|nr:cation:proton antiporter [Methanolinea mesophila]MBP1927742.1 CPA2 family monovalent cation:H+ antiporter-2 [Methanolinea mesophila]